MFHLWITTNERKSLQTSHSKYSRYSKLNLTVETPLCLDSSWEMIVKGKTEEWRDQVSGVASTVGVVQSWLGHVWNYKDFCVHVLSFTDMGVSLFITFLI